MVKPILVPVKVDAGTTAQIDTLVGNLSANAQSIKNELGAKAFDVLTGNGGTTPEIERELNAGKGQVDTYLSIAQDLQILAAGMQNVAGGIPVFFATEADSVKISKPRNVPTLVLSTNTDPLTTDTNIFVQHAEGCHYVQVTKVDVVSGEGEVSDEYILTGKILGTLVPGIHVEAEAATTKRTTASKPANSGKPSKKPEASQSRARKPRK